MAPKPKCRDVHVDGVRCTISLSTNHVTVGTGLVSNAERDTGWKFKGDARTPTDEELTALMVPLVRARPKFARFKELAAAAGSPASAEPSANTPAADHSGMGS